MTTRTPPLGYAVAHFGRLTLTSRDYAVIEASCGCEDGEEYYLNDAGQYRELLLKHGHDAADLVAWWKHESRDEAAEQRQAYRLMMQERLQMGAYRA